MRIEDALRVSGRAGGVTHACRGVLVEGLPGKIAIDFAHPLLVRHGVLERGLRHVRRIAQQHVTFDAGQLVGELFQERNEGHIGQQQAILGVIDDPGDLIGKEPRIDRMVDRADSHDTVPGLDMTPRVPGERGDAITEPNSVLFETLRQAQGARADLGVGGGVKRPLDGARDNRPLGVVGCGMVEEAMAKERPVLHQPKHGVFLWSLRLQLHGPAQRRPWTAWPPA